MRRIASSSDGRRAEVRASSEQVLEPLRWGWIVLAGLILQAAREQAGAMLASGRR